MREGVSELEVKRIATALGVVVAFALSATPAIAADDTGINVLPGSLSVTNPMVANFPDLTLNGSAQSSSAAMDTFEVTDARGSGAGWRVQVSATQFCEWDSLLSICVVGGKTLPTGSLSVPAPSVAANGTSSPVPSVTSGPYAVDGSTVTVASASVGNGMGKYVFTPGNLTLSVPASAYAKTYRSTVTVSVVSGP